MWKKKRAEAVETERSSAPPSDFSSLADSLVHRSSRTLGNITGTVQSLFRATSQNDFNLSEAVLGFSRLRSTSAQISWILSTWGNSARFIQKLLFAQKQPSSAHTAKQKFWENSGQPKMTRLCSEATNVTSLWIKAQAHTGCTSGFSSMPEGLFDLVLKELDFDQFYWTDRI